MPFNGFVDEFTNSPVQTAPSSYLEIDFGSETDLTITLEWSFQNPNTLYPFSQVIQAINGIDSGNYIITMPDATVTSVGQTVYFFNATDANITINAANNVLIEVVEPGLSYLFTLTDNSTDEGVWLSIQNGAGTSSASAASLIDTSTDGNSHMNNGGLNAFGSYLKQNQRVYVFNGLTYNQSTGDRGSLLVWTGGNGTYNCRSSATNGNGYTFSIHNASTTGGVIEVTPNGSDKIDNDSVFTIRAGESASFISDGSNNYYSLGFGQQLTNPVTQTDISLSDAVSAVLEVSETQAGNLILNFIDSYNAPTYDDVTVVLPSNLTNQYYIHNSSTTNDIFVQVGTASTPNSYQVTKNGSRTIIFTDPSTAYNIPDFFDLDKLLLNNGTVSAPSLTFTQDTTTGIYRNQVSGESLNALSIAQNGVNVANFLSNKINFSTNLNQESISIYSIMRAYGI